MPAKKKQDFESLMQALEAVTLALEKGGVSLEESIELYGRGTELARQLEAMLVEGERRVTLLTPSGAEVSFDGEHTG